LEETQGATLLMHVIDAFDEGRHERIYEVNEVLKEVGAHAVPQLEVYNKIDLVEEAQPRIDRDELGRPLRVWVSAKSGEGLELLKHAVTELLQWQEAKERGENPKFGTVSSRQHYLL
jgi:GTP-binding protein HflX